MRVCYSSALFVYFHLISYAERQTCCESSIDIHSLSDKNRRSARNKTRAQNQLPCIPSLITSLFSFTPSKLEPINVAAKIGKTPSQVESYILYIITCIPSILVRSLCSLYDTHDRRIRNWPDQVVTCSNSSSAGERERDNFVRHSLVVAPLYDKTRGRLRYATSFSAPGAKSIM